MESRTPGIDFVAKVDDLDELPLINSMGRGQTSFPGSEREDDLKECFAEQTMVTGDQAPETSDDTLTQQPRQGE